MDVERGGTGPVGTGEAGTGPAGTGGAGTGPAGTGGAGTVRRILDEHGLRALRYTGASAVGVFVSQVILWITNAWGWSFVASNITAVTISAVPAFYLNKRWVWENDGKVDLMTEVLPFWGMGLAGLILSTALVAVADNYSDSGLALSAANLTAFGSLWIIKYFALDSWMFGPGKHEPDDLAEASAA